MKLTVSLFPDHGCIHSLRGRRNELCTGVPGSFEGHIFRFRSGQVATIENFQQRCSLLISAGIRKQDPMYIAKTCCLSRDVVNALKAAQSDTALLTRCDPVQPDLDASKRRLRFLGYKSAYIECDNWSDVLELFPALRDRNNPSTATLYDNFPRRKAFTPHNCSMLLVFVSELAVCACHISPDDVKHENRVKGCISLKLTAILRTPDYFLINAAPEREAPLKRCVGNTPLAQHLSQQLDDTFERLVRVQKAAFENTVDTEIQYLLQAIAELKEQAVAAEEAKAATLKDLLAAQTDARTTTAELLKVLQMSKDVADAYAIEASEALAAAKANVDFIANSFVVENVDMFSRMRTAANALVKDSESKTLSWTHDTVKSICDSARAPSEYARFRSMFNPKATSVAQATAISASARGKAISRERRAIISFFVAIGATSERFTLLRNAIDDVIHVPRSKHIIASSLGILPSLSASDRHDKELVRNYFSRIDEIISKWLQLALTCDEVDLKAFLENWEPPFCLISWADDYVRNWNKAVFSDQRTVRLAWAVIALKRGNLRPARPLSVGNDALELNIPTSFQCEYLTGVLLGLPPTAICVQHFFLNVSWLHNHLNEKLKQ